MKKKIVVSKCCGTPVILIPKGLLNTNEVFLCTKCNKVCEIKPNDDKLKD